MKIFFICAAITLLSLPLSAEETKSGSKFVRDRTNPQLGEAWRDSSGMIWGDMTERNQDSEGFCTENRNREQCHLSYSAAKAYCDSIDAKLPTLADMVRFKGYMGEDHMGYEPQILPNLDVNDSSFWLEDTSSHSAAFFIGRYGTIFYRFQIYTDLGVRCVVDS